MVSLRSGSTTDNKEPQGPPEVSSRRISRRQTEKKSSRLASTKKEIGGSEAQNLKIHTARGKKKESSSQPLAVIAESPREAAPTSPRGVLDKPFSMDATTESGQAAKPVQRRMKRQPSLDTPAKHPRSRDRHTSVKSGREAAPAQERLQDDEASGKERLLTRMQAGSSAKERAAKVIDKDAAESDLATAPGLVQVNGTDDEDRSSSFDEGRGAIGHEGKVSAASSIEGSGNKSADSGDEAASSSGSESEGLRDRLPYLRATAARGGGAGATAGDASGDAAAAPDHDGNASSGWSSDDDEEQGGANIGLAERMLAALSNLGSSSSAAAGPASVPQKQRQQSYLSFRIGSRKEREAGGNACVEPDLDLEGVEELHWEPTLKLPSPVRLTGDQDDMLESLSAGPLPSIKEDADAVKQLKAPPRDARLRMKEARKIAPDTAGRDWFDLPAQQITDEVKRDLRLLRLRGTLDPKRFYKSFDQTKFPKYFQVGTVVEGPADFYSGRLKRKERKGTLTEELLADPVLAETRAKRFGALQEERQRWSHKQVKRKTNNERKKVHKRPRH